MSIDPNVGALKDYLTDITTSQSYNKLKTDVWNVLGKMSKFGKSAQEIASKMEHTLKSILLQQSNLFESLNLRYFGPVDGHDVDHLVHVMEDLKRIPGPKILHCITTKGKGYALAEKDQTKWHAPGKFDKMTGVIRKKEIEQWGIGELGVAHESVGLKGSPTIVSELSAQEENKRQAEMITGTRDEKADMLVQKLVDAGVL